MPHVQQVTSRHSTVINRALEKPMALASANQRSAALLFRESCDVAGHSTIPAGPNLPCQRCVENVGQTNRNGAGVLPKLTRHWGTDES